MLAQRKSGLDKYERPYANRTLTKAENNYSVREKPCLAIVGALNEFRPYRYGRTFEVFTDHHALSMLKDPSDRLACLALQLQDFDMRVVYRSGCCHANAIALSRSPVSADITACISAFDELFSGAAGCDMASAQRKGAEISALLRILANP